MDKETPAVNRPVVGEDVWPELERIFGLEVIRYPVSLTFDFACGRAAVGTLRFYITAEEMTKLLTVVKDKDVPIIKEATTDFAEMSSKL